MKNDEWKLSEIDVMGETKACFINYERNEVRLVQEPYYYEPLLSIIHNEPKEQDVCPECGGTKLDFSKAECHQGYWGNVTKCSCNGKAPVESEAVILNNWKEEYLKLVTICEQYKAEIERLIKIIEDMPADYIPDKFWKPKENN